MKKHGKEPTPKPTQFDVDESVGDSALATEKEGKKEPKSFDEDESIGNSNMDNKKRNK